MINLYKWRSELLKNYARGHIIVMASSVEEARKKVRDNIITCLKETCSWVFLGDELDPDYSEEFAEKLALFEKDISVEPELVDSGVIFINGSE